MQDKNITYRELENILTKTLNKLATEDGYLNNEEPTAEQIQRETDRRDDNGDLIDRDD